MREPPHSIDELPQEIPIFPLAGVLLLPRGRLPLQMFEPRYVALAEDAVAGDQVIGMIQPRRQERQTPDDTPEVFETGCLGRIVEHSTTPDGRHLVTLAGVCRFAVSQELEGERGYRRVVPSWDRFLPDLDEELPATGDSARLEAAVRAYCRGQDIEVDWDSLEGLDLGGRIAAQFNEKYADLGYSPEPDAWEGPGSGGLLVFTPQKAIAWFDFPTDVTRFSFR